MVVRPFLAMVMDGDCMELHYRQKDVDKLVCNAAQDFLKMLLKQGWQNKLYTIAKEAKENNRKYKDKYIHAYETMRDYGIENYTVEKMDFTLISSIINYGHKFLPEIAMVSNESKKAINMLREDKNSFASHSNQNESLAEKYLQCIFTLYHLKQFIRAVGDKEEFIPEKKRASYRQNYISRADELISQLDQDRYELIYEQKSIEDNLQKILRCNDRRRAWWEMTDVYDQQIVFAKAINNTEFERSKRLLDKFYIASSYAGISEAHTGAMLRLIGNYPADKVVQHIKHINPFPLNLAMVILGQIHDILFFYPERYDEFLPIIQAIREKGYEVEEHAKFSFSVHPISDC